MSGLHGGGGNGEGGEDLHLPGQQRGRHPRGGGVHQGDPSSLCRATSFVTQFSFNDI